MYSSVLVFAKKLEASRKSIRSDIDFVLTFEEVMGMFNAKGIALDQITTSDPLTEGTNAGRGFALSVVVLPKPLKT